MRSSSYSTLSPGSHTLPIGGELMWSPGWLSAPLKQAIWDEFSSHPQLHQGQVKIYGKHHLTPRLQAWFSGHDYRYSGVTLPASPLPDMVQHIIQQLHQTTGYLFNSVLVNLYRDGQDHMGWHSDDEPELVSPPVVASLSLGAERDFLLKPRRAGSAAHQYKLPLGDGDLLLMGPHMQQHWLHSLPKRARVSTPRLNLTFRLLS